MTVVPQRWTTPIAEPNESGGFVAYGDYLELAHRLEEAQKQIVAQQAFLNRLRKVFATRFPVCRDCADEDGSCPNSGLPCTWPMFDDGKVLAAHDAETAAKALEEADKFIQIHGDGAQPAYSHCRELISEKAVEYRAKAKGEKP